MSTYYGSQWDVYEVEAGGADGGISEASETGWQDRSGLTDGSASGAQSHRSRSGSQWSAHGNRYESYDIGSNSSAGGSWWRSPSWSWESWDGSSDGGSNENWVYVQHRDEGRHSWRRDPWHEWHRDGGRRSNDEGHHSNRRLSFSECSGDDAGDRQCWGEPQEDDGPKGELPSGKISSVAEKADKEEQRRSQGKVSSSYPPVFKARQGENYRDWKRSVKFWLKGEGSQLPMSLVGARVMVQLRERAAELVKHLEPEDVEGETGLNRIFATLEASPLVKQHEKHRVDWHRKRLLSLNRVAGESIESYITRACLYRSQLEGLDSALAMGERFFVGHLLDHAKLTRKDRAMVKTHAGDETEVNITRALIDLSAELEGEQGFPIGQSEPQLGGSQGEEHLIRVSFSEVCWAFDLAVVGKVVVPWLLRLRMMGSLQCHWVAFLRNLTVKIVWRKMMPRWMFYMRSMKH